MKPATVRRKLVAKVNALVDGDESLLVCQSSEFETRISRIAAAAQALNLLEEPQRLQGELLVLEECEAPAPKAPAAPEAHPAV